MEAGVSDHVWSLEEIAGLVPPPVVKKRGHYNKEGSEPMSDAGSFHDAVRRVP